MKQWKKHKFNWVDGLILAVVVLLVAGTCLKFLILDTTSVNKDSVDFAYEIKISDVRQVSVDALQVGDTLYDNEGKGAVGTISAIEVEGAVSTASFSNGTVAEVPVEDRYDVTLTVSAQGTPDGGSYKIGTYAIKVNQYSLYFTKYSIWSGTVMSID